MELLVFLYMYTEDPGGLTLKKHHVRDMESRRHDPHMPPLPPAVHTSKVQQMHGAHHHRTTAEGGFASRKVGEKLL
jgi:hypothetical protein